MAQYISKINDTGLAASTDINGNSLELGLNSSSEVATIGGHSIAGGGGGGSSDHKVSVNASDTAPGYLGAKLAAGDNIILTVENNSTVKITSPSDIDDFATPRIDSLTKGDPLCASQSDKYSITGHMFQVEAEYQFAEGDSFEFLVTNASSGATVWVRMAIFMLDPDAYSMQLIAFSEKFDGSSCSKGFHDVLLDKIVDDGTYNGKLVPGKQYYACFMLNSTSNSCGVAGLECASFGLMSSAPPLSLKKDNVGLFDSGADDFISRYSTVSISTLAEGTFKPYMRFYHEAE